MIEPSIRIVTSLDTTKIFTATMLIGTAAFMVFGLQPILLGGLTETGRLSESGLGQAATIEIFGLALGATIGPRFMNSGSMRLHTGVACLLLALADLGIYWTNTPMQILALRGLAGLLEGLSFATVNLIINHTRQPHRTNGLFLAIATVPQILAAYLLPVLIVPRYGVNAGFAVLAALALLGVVASPGLPDRVVLRSAPQERRRWGSPAIIAFLSAALVQYAGIGAAWNYTEQLARQQGFSAEIVGVAIAGSLASQVPGALIAAWLGPRLPQRLILLLGIVFQVIVVSIMFHVRLPSAFTAAACGFGFLWLGLQPFQVKELVELDPSLRAVLLLFPVGFVGLSLGPLLVSFAVLPRDVSGGFWGAVALFVVGGLLYLVALAVQRIDSYRAVPPHR